MLIAKEMHGKSIVQIGLLYKSEPFIRLKKQNNLLQFHRLPEIRELVTTTPPSPQSSPLRKNTDERRIQWWRINRVPLDPWD